MVWSESPDAGGEGGAGLGGGAAAWELGREDVRGSEMLGCSGKHRKQTALISQ